MQKAVAILQEQTVHYFAHEDIFIAGSSGVRLLCARGRLSYA